MEGQNETRHERKRRKKNKRKKKKIGRKCEGVK